MPQTKKTPSSAPAKKPAAKKPRAPKAIKEERKAASKEDLKEERKAEHKTPAHEAAHAGHLNPGKYFYGVGRRKTSVANIRMFFGKSENQVNKKKIDAYFGLKGYVGEALKPLQLTGLESQVYIYANVKGGGAHSQAQAVAHGLANAIAASDENFRKVLKKNGMLTRDSRMKERKKPGLKRARRGPQWAKR